MKTETIVATVAVAGVLGGAFLLGIDKVKNEHRMTEMYERQAVALERIANARAEVAVPKLCGELMYPNWAPRPALGLKNADGTVKELKWPLSICIEEARR